MAPWSLDRISEWYARQPLLIGANYLPRTAVNWTELWQHEGFDLATIEQELGWAERIGMNAVKTQTVARGTFHADVPGTRTLGARTSPISGVKIGGRILSMLTDHGDRLDAVAEPVWQGGPVLHCASRPVPTRTLWSGGSHAVIQPSLAGASTSASPRCGCSAPKRSRSSCSSAVGPRVIGS